jgi:hypothetical protein
MRANDLLMLLLVALSSIITVAIFFQRPVDVMLIVGSCGFTLFTLGWTGMYFRLKRELPEHKLVTATYLNLAGAFGGRRSGLENMLGLIRLHFDRHHIDVWSAVFVVGLAMLGFSLIRSRS